MEIDSDSTKWEKCARSRFTYITVENLRPEHSYQFKISAENKYGISDCCNPTVPITIPVSRTKKQGFESGISKSATSTSWVSIVRRAESGTDISAQSQFNNYSLKNNFMSKNYSTNLKTLNNLSFSRFLSPNIDYGKSRRSVSPSSSYSNLSLSRKY